MVATDLELLTLEMRGKSALDIITTNPKTRRRLRDSIDKRRFLKILKLADNKSAVKLRLQEKQAAVLICRV